MVFKGLVVFLLGLVAWKLWRRWSRTTRERFIRDFAYAERLDRRLAARRPELSEAQRNEVFAALRDYFLLCRRAGRRMVAMPSQAVDDAWHEFILFTRAYEQFCGRAFGRFLHHTPAEAMATPTQAGEGIRRAWRLACAHEGINAKAPDRLPRLFALDAQLGIVGGFVYALDCLAGQMAGKPVADGSAYCASHIGCSSGGCGGGGCSGDSGSADGGGGDGGSGCGGGCGGGGD